MRDLKTQISDILEKSISAKRRDMKNAKEVFTKGKGGYNGISHFGVLTAENPSSAPLPGKDNKKLLDSLKKSLKSGHYTWVGQLGHFGGNDEHSLFVFNIGIDQLKYYCGQYDQTSFIYGEIRDGKVLTEYWEKETPDEPYHPKTNPYVKKDECLDWVDARGKEDYSVIGKKFKYTIPFSIFESVNEKINTNLEMVDESNRICALQMAVFGVGESAWRYRGLIYKNI